MPLLEVDAVTRQFELLKAVDNVSFAVEPGSIVGIIGPNGAGKSTLFRMLATVDAPTSGRILLNGKSVTEHPTAARPYVGYMPERHGTYDNTTVFEFLDFFARAYQLQGRVRQQRLEAVMDFTGLGSLRDRLTKDLSKGMNQRVALARALIHDPLLLILDEPADGLDPRARIELRELLKVLASQGKGILISSHILTELGELCERCLVLQRGKVVALGDVNALVAQATSQATVCRLLLELAVEPKALTVSQQHCERVLLELPLVKQVQLLQSVVAVDLQFDSVMVQQALHVETATARLIDALVRAGVPLCAVRREEVSLETAFLAVTSGGQI
jgi:ABC-2 type transport system ATP-binding protein